MDEENPYWMSFSDIMAGLLVIFVLAVVALVLELMQKRQDWDAAINEIREAEEVRAELLREIEQELRKKDIRVSLGENDTVLRIPEDVLAFRSGRYEVPEDERSQKVTLEIGRVLFASIEKNDRWKYLDTVFVEGHTDKIPYRNAAIQENWGLSTFRAISVWRYWNEKLPKGQRPEELVSHDHKKLFSVSGYAETRPRLDTLKDPDSKKSLKKNRRIDIRFTIKRPSLADFEKIKAKLK
ncbi:OmpA/MotB family protein [Microbulbifer marinus]|uniref:OmpA/MotB family protein n=1 Tax=Microbulbifer marinus TaxID=658218 RepID=UPI001FCDBBF8|nr:OmpA family protein [Microbulbifer marinus]